MRLVLLAIAATAAFAQTPTGSAVTSTLDFEFFKTRVQPIFLAKRPGHARCYVCHSIGTPFRLERLSRGATTWNDEQSRRNFEMVEKLVNPGDPDTSRLLLHPLGPEGGGDVFHSGGRQFPSKDDPAWRTLAAFVNGATLASKKQ